MVTSEICTGLPARVRARARARVRARVRVRVRVRETGWRPARWTVGHRL